MDFKALQYAVIWAVTMGKLTDEEHNSVVRELDLHPIRLSFISHFEKYVMIEGTNDGDPS